MHIPQLYFFAHLRSRRNNVIPRRGYVVAAIDEKHQKHNSDCRQRSDRPGRNTDTAVIAGKQRNGEDPGKQIQEKPNYFFHRSFPFRHSSPAKRLHVPRTPGTLHVFRALPREIHFTLPGKTSRCAPAQHFTFSPRGIPAGREPAVSPFSRTWFPFSPCLSRRRRRRRNRR